MKTPEEVRSRLNEALGELRVISERFLEEGEPTHEDELRVAALCAEVCGFYWVLCREEELAPLLNILRRVSNGHPVRVKERSYVARAAFTTASPPGFAKTPRTALSS
jgi:hypothetical protein